MKFNELNATQKTEFINTLYENMPSESIYEYVYDILYKNYSDADDDINDDINMYDIEFSGVIQ